MSAPPLTSQPSRDDLITELNELTLPMMWQMRQDAMRAFEPLGVRPIKALLIELIARGMQHPKDLSEVLDTVPPTISAMLAELEEKDFIARQIDPADRRRVRLELTPRGNELRANMRQLWHEIGRERMACLSQQELATFITIGRKLSENS